MYIDEVELQDKRILLRDDFDVPIVEGRITNDLRIVRSIPTIKKLLEGNNKIICIGHLGRPEGRDEKDSLAPVVTRLKELLPEITVTLINDFLTEPHETFDNHTSREILVLENIRFYPEEKTPTEAFSKKLSSLGDVFVQDAFAVCHREETSITELPKLLPSYGGLSLKNELAALETVLEKPTHPYVVIIGGAKTETKLPAIKKLMSIADTLLIGGAVANTFFASEGKEIGKSLYDKDFIDQAKQLDTLAHETHTRILFPTDVVVLEEETTSIVKTANVPANGSIMDIGPETQELFANEIVNAQTIVWNGPVGDTDDERFIAGSKAVYEAIISNTDSYSLIGGGDTTTLVLEQPDHEKISYISTGGGAMLDYIENGTLVGIEALKNH